MADSKSTIVTLSSKHLDEDVSLADPAIRNDILHLAKEIIDKVLINGGSIEIHFGEATQAADSAPPFDKLSGKIADEIRAAVEAGQKNLFARYHIMGGEELAHDLAQWLTEAWLPVYMAMSTEPAACLLNIPEDSGLKEFVKAITLDRVDMEASTIRALFESWRNRKVLD